MMLDSSPVKLKEMWANTLGRRMGSFISRGIREAKWLDEVNATLVSHVVERSQEGLFQLAAIQYGGVWVHEKLYLSIPGKEDYPRKGQEHCTPMPFPPPFFFF